MKSEVIFHKEFEGARFPERGSEGAAGMDFFVPKPTSINDPCFNYMKEKCLSSVEDEDTKKSINSIFERLMYNDPEVAFIASVFQYNKYVFGNKDIDYEVPVSTKNPPQLILKPNTCVNIPSGLSVDLPHGYALDFRNKSGIATKKHLVIGAELVDEDYTGVMHLNLHNIGKQEVRLICGMKVAQAVFERTYYDDLIITNSETQLEKKTDRGAGGFGSTGLY